MRFKLTTLALALLVPVSAFAQDPAPVPPAPPVAAPAPEPLPPPPPPPQVEAAPAAPAPAPAAAAPTAPTIKWEGLVDSYYQYNFTGDPSTQDPALRAYDTQANSFTLAYAKLGAGIDFGVAAARLDFGFGQTAAIVNAGSILSSDAAGANGAPSATATQLYLPGVLVEQAYGTLKLGSMLTLDLGKFNTSAGAEVIPSNKNWLYSRSLLFNGITVNHTGLRGTLTASKEVTIQAAVVNGWNNDPDNNGDKTFGLSLLITPVDGTFLGLNTYIGKEQPTGSATTDATILVDVVANQAIGPNLQLNLNFDYYKLGDANWWGLALMGKYVISPGAYLAARGEYLKTKAAAYAALSQDTAIEEGTICLGLPFGSNFELRIEGRGDFSDQELFKKGADPKKNQITGTAAFLAFF
jgi:hypothetical protein